MVEVKQKREAARTMTLAHSIWQATQEKSGRRVRNFFQRAQNLRSRPYSRAPATSKRRNVVGLRGYACERAHFA